jgi:serine/threonine-protein kinase
VSVVIARVPLVPVPGVAGQNPFAAAATLGGAGFQVTVAEEPNDTVAKGAVVRTDPAEGTPVPKGSPVTVYVSSGPGTVPIPSLVGQTRATAEAVLHDQLGFGLTISLVNAGPTRKGLVVAQNPAGGQAAKGSAIALVVGI